MKNSEIHKGFEKQEIRDFLAKQYREGMMNSTGSVEQLQKRINQLKEELEYAKQSEAARALMTTLGWKPYDIERVISDYDSNSYFPFVGTEKELFSLPHTKENEND